MAVQVDSNPSRKRASRWSSPSNNSYLQKLTTGHPKQINYEVRNNYLLFLCGGERQPVCGGKPKCGLRVECVGNRHDNIDPSFYSVKV